MFQLDKMCPITCVDSYCDPATNTYLLVLGDELGYVRVQDISLIFADKSLNLQPIDLVTGNHKRNPHRVLPLDNVETK